MPGLIDRAVHALGIETTVTAPRADADVPARVSVAPMCWFCRTEVHEEQHLAAPGEKQLWRICKTCVLEATVAFMLSGVLSLRNIVDAFNATVHRRRTTSNLHATMDLEPLIAAEERVHRDLIELRTRTDTTVT